MTRPAVTRPGREAARDEEEAPPAKAPPAKAGPPFDAEEEFRQLRDWVTQLERAMAGYNKLRGAVATAAGQKAGRRQGMPIFEMPATADGASQVRVVLDLKHLDPRYADHVLVPLANMLAGEVYEALTEADLRFQRLKAHFGALFAAAEPGPPPD